MTRIRWRPQALKAELYLFQQPEAGQQLQQILGEEFKGLAIKTPAGDENEAPPFSNKDGTKPEIEPSGKVHETVTELQVIQTRSVQIKPTLASSLLFTHRGLSVTKPIRCETLSYLVTGGLGNLSLEMTISWLCTVLLFFARLWLNTFCAQERLRERSAAAEQAAKAVEASEKALQSRLDQASTCSRSCGPRCIPQISKGSLIIRAVSADAVCTAGSSIQDPQGGGHKKECADQILAGAACRIRVDEPRRGLDCTAFCSRRNEMFYCTCLMAILLTEECEDE